MGQLSRRPTPQKVLSSNILDTMVSKSGQKHQKSRSSRHAANQFDTANILSQMVTAGGANDTKGANDILSQTITSRGGMAGGSKNKRSSSNILFQMVTARGGPAGGANNIRVASMQDFGRALNTVHESSNRGRKAPNEEFALTKRNTSSPSELATARSMGRLTDNHHNPPNASKRHPLSN